MHVNITGRIAKKKQIELFVYNVMQYLMPRLKRQVGIDIAVVSKCDGNNSALCWGDKDGVEIEIARQSFDYKFTLEEMMLNLSHELVHAKQFIKGDLHPNLNKWKRIDFSNVPYSRTPWEKEAYLLEDKLVNKFWK
jgi:hypothetical protein